MTPTKELEDRIARKWGEHSRDWAWRVYQLGHADGFARVATPAAPAPHANCPAPVDATEAAEREHLGCAHCNTGIYTAPAPAAPNDQQVRCTHGASPDICTKCHRYEGGDVHRGIFATSPTPTAPKCTRCEYIGKCDCEPAPAAQVGEIESLFWSVYGTRDDRGLRGIVKEFAQRFAARQQSATPAEPVQKRYVTLTGAQLLEALDFIAPDKDADQLESEVTIQYGDGHSGAGHYCWVADDPEEGAILLDGTTITPADAAQADDWRSACRAAVSHLDYESGVPQAVQGALRALKAAMRDRQQSATPAEPVINESALTAAVWQRICELPDRNSPEGEPDACVLTLREFSGCMANALEDLNLLPPQGIAAPPECTCPSGNGSLRHPCPVHPADAASEGDKRNLYERAYRHGWINCSKWAERVDLVSDVDSPAYEKERDEAYAVLVQRERQQGAQSNG